MILFVEKSTHVAVGCISSLLLSFPLFAESFQSKEWTWGTSEGGYYYAATSNSAGNTFGQYCYFESATCVYLVGLGTTCDVGSEYPALINSDAGSVHVTLACGNKVFNQQVYGVKAFDDVDRIIRNATRMGIVIPLQGDEFKVSRFGLAGSTYAIDLMRTATEAKIQREPVNASKPVEERI